MDISLLRNHIANYKKKQSEGRGKNEADLRERKEREEYYRSFSKEKILGMTEETFYEYMAKLWAMLIWGNKKYAVDKIITNNGFDNIKRELAELIWGDANISQRWDHFRKNAKGFGPATISEILCNVHPKDCLIWNRRAYIGFNYLGVKNLPQYDYQVTGKKYTELIVTGKEIAKEMISIGIQDADLMTVDYFIWDELQVEDNLSKLSMNPLTQTDVDTETSKFIHNEIRDKLADIGKWLGFNSDTERKVADGSRVDTIWEWTIGNMGRIIYVFEVQTKGSTDSLILNLLKAQNNPAVQGVVAVSDEDQLEQIKKQVSPIGELNKKLKYWNYQEILDIHESLEMINLSINKLGLVPRGFNE